MPFYVTQASLNYCKEIKLVIDKYLRQNIKVLKDLTIFLEQRVNPRCSAFFLSPEWNEMQTNAAFIMRELLPTFPKWRLSLQTHKWINIE